MMEDDQNSPHAMSGVKEATGEMSQLKDSSVNLDELKPQSGTPITPQHRVWEGSASEQAISKENAAITGTSGPALEKNSLIDEESSITGLTSKYFILDHHISGCLYKKCTINFESMPPVIDAEDKLVQRPPKTTIFRVGMEVFVDSLRRPSMKGNVFLFFGIEHTSKNPLYSPVVLFNVTKFNALQTKLENVEDYYSTGVVVICPVVYVARVDGGGALPATKEICVLAQPFVDRFLQYVFDTKLVLADLDIKNLAPLKNSGSSKKSMTLRGDTNSLPSKKTNFEENTTSSKVATPLSPTSLITTINATMTAGFTKLYKDTSGINSNKLIGENAVLKEKVKTAETKVKSLETENIKLKDKLKRLQKKKE